MSDPIEVIGSTLRVRRALADREEGGQTFDEGQIIADLGGPADCAIVAVQLGRRIVFRGLSAEWPVQLN